MRVLITGAAGFIGMHLSAALMQRGHQVVGFDNLSGISYDRELKLARLRHLGLEINEATMQRLAAGEALQIKGFTFYQQDLCDREKLQSLVAQGNFEVVVNLAALAGVRLSTEIPEQYVQSNFQGFFNLLEVLQFDSFRLPTELRKPFMEDATALCEAPSFEVAKAQLDLMRNKWEHHLPEGTSVLQGNIDQLQLYTYLSPEERKIFDEAAAEAQKVEFAAWKGSIDAAKKKATEMGVQFINVDVNEFRNKVLPLHEQILNDTPALKPLYDAASAANASV